MIHELITIKSIGKFRSFNKKGDLTLRKLTLIYAENGSGKTTLTSILRSLSNQDESIIHNRRSTNSAEKPLVKLMFNDGVNKQITFDDKGWNKNISDIEIFDCFFIDENIYSGFEFNNEHKVGLYRFILGSEGVEISNKITKNKEEKAEKRKLYDRVYDTVVELCGNHKFTDPLNESWFKKIKLDETDDIDTKVSAAKAEVKQALISEEIKKKVIPSQEKDWLINVDWKGLEQELNVSLATIQSLALEDLFNDHISELTGSGVENAESWARNGLSYIFYHEAHKEDHTETNCPFCRKPLSKEQDIITAYTQKFDEYYQIHIKSLKKFLDQINEADFELEYTRRQSRETTFIDLIQYWQQYIDDIKLITYPNIVIDDFMSFIKDLKNVIKEKIDFPAKSISTEIIKSVIEHIHNVNDSVHVFNQKIVHYELIINQFKNNLKNTKEADFELLKLNLVKRRYDEDIVDCLNDLSNIKSDIKALENEYKDLMTEQEDNAEKFITKYGVSVNNYLKKVFKIPYSLEKIVRQPPIGKATASKVDYSLHFDGHEVSSNSNSPLNAKYCFSEGDKSTIALAFFLSKIDAYEKNDELKNKIIVFDDPLSSLDFNRRRRTIKQIARIAKEAKQVIVLSHNDAFIHELYNMEDIKNSRVTLCINYSEGSSNIVPFCIDTHMKDKDSLSRSYKFLKNFLEAPTLDNKVACLSSIRTSLESSLKKKNFTLIGNHNTTFPSLIKEIEDNPKILFRGQNDRKEVIESLRELDSISWTPHHGQGSNVTMDWSNSLENITLDELRAYVEDTIELIDHVL